MMRVVVCVRGGMAGLAASRCLPICMLVDNLSYQAQYAAHNVSDNNLAWLCRGQASADLSDTFDKLYRIPSLELANYA